MHLLGRNALVTGASKGVGKGIAIELARHGCDVVVNYHSDRAGALATVAEIESMGRRSIALAADIGYSPDVSKLFGEARAFFPTIDILVNNAGVQTWKPLLELEESEWDRVLRTNLKGCFLCTQAAARWIVETQGGQRRGRVINIGSGCNKVAFPNLVDYTASKGGLEMFTKVSASELGQYGITVNCVAPGAIEIERTKQEAGDYRETWARLTPLGRVGNPMDIGNVVSFLAGDDAAFVTGQTIWVDGGLFTRPAWPY